MDAKEYMLKVAEICDLYGYQIGCEKCPLLQLACGSPLSEQMINESMKAVENYKLEESNENRS